jgi:mannose-6-phosphate isomerase-like protein (cupin superfamily)
VSVAAFPDGEECGTHNHRGAHEFFYAVGGYGIITVDSVRYNVQCGDSILVPAGVNHNIMGVGSDDREGKFQVLCGFVVAPSHENDETPWDPVVTE